LRDSSEELTRDVIENKDEIMAERVGFESSNAVPCTVLPSLVRTEETKRLLAFGFRSIFS